jgi:hypothetical protein
MALVAYDSSDESHHSDSDEDRNIEDRALAASSQINEGNN